MRIIQVRVPLRAFLRVAGVGATDVTSGKAMALLMKTWTDELFLVKLFHRGVARGLMRLIGWLHVQIDDCD
jgi:hypothetical protein